MMKWKALRMDADGNTFYSTSEMVKTADASDVDVTKCTRATVQYWPESKLSYIEMHASIAEDGTITLTKAKMHPENSGIEW